MKYHTLFFRKLGEMSQILSSAAVVIGALRVNGSNSRNPLTGTFHQYIHCLLRQNLSEETEIHYCLDIIACGPFIYICNGPFRWFSSLKG